MMDKIIGLSLMLKKSIFFGLKIEKNTFYEQLRSILLAQAWKPS